MTRVTTGRRGEEEAAEEVENRTLLSTHLAREKGRERERERERSDKHRSEIQMGGRSGERPVIRRDSFGLY